jgi:DNA-binding IclR family transcriptional regulator
LSEITRLLKKPTVHRLATDLVAKRIRERGIHDYRLGLHLFELGQRAPGNPCRPLEPRRRRA